MQPHLEHVTQNLNLINSNTEHKIERKAIRGFLTVFGRPLSVIIKHVILIHIAEQIPIKDLKLFKAMNLLFMTLKKIMKQSSASSRQ